MGEEAFQKKLHSLLIGCIIIGILQLISVVGAISNLSNGGGYSSLIMPSLIILDMVGTYYYTSKKKKVNHLNPLSIFFYTIILFYYILTLDNI